MRTGNQLQAFINIYSRAQTPEMAKLFDVVIHDQRAAVVLTLCEGYSSHEAAEMLQTGLRKLRVLL